MPFTVKATYRSETRKLSFPECNTFPSFDQLYHQLYRVFPISHSVVLSKLLFSPDSSNSRVLLSREVRTAEEYVNAVAPFAGKAWANPLLRVSVSDETPHKLPAITHASQHQASSPQKPIVSNPFPVVEPSFGRISYSHIPPPPIIFSSRPSPQEPTGTGETETSVLHTVPQHDAASCCAAQIKKDVQDLISGFKVDLDRAIASLGSRSPEVDQSQKESTTSPFTAPRDSIQSTPPQKLPLQTPLNVLQSSPILSLPSVPIHPPLCQYNLCWRCGVIKQGPWFDCAICTNKLCLTCLETASISDCFFGSPHVWKKQTCNYCAPSSTPAVPSPLQPTSLGPTQLNSFGSPLLPSVPTMPPVAIEEVLAEAPAHSPTVPFAVPVAQNESARNEDGRVVHHGVLCDSCYSVIEGIRHKCLDCPDYDLCTTCIGNGAAGNHNPFHEFFEISEPGRVVVHNVYSGSGEREQSAPSRRHNEDPAQSSQPVIHNAVCDLCESRIRGDRHKCLECPDWDCCANCFSITGEQHPRHSFVKITHPDHFLRRYTDDVRQHSATCDSCSQQIFGIRYKCMHPDCPDFDLCSVCEALPIAVHPVQHPMLKIKHPDYFTRSDTDNVRKHYASCNHCSRQIIGIRYKCMHQDCPDFDLCSECEALPHTVHPTHHPLLKVKDVATVIPTVHRSNLSLPQPVATGTARDRSLDIQPTPCSPRAPSPPGSYESGFLRNPGVRADGIRSPEVLLPSPFDFRSESARSQLSEYYPSEMLPTSLPAPAPVRIYSPVSIRSPSPVMMIPGAMPTFFNLPPIESLSLSPMLRASPITLPPIQSAPPVAPSSIRTPSPLWKNSPYARPHSPPLIPGQYLSESQSLSTRPPSPEPLCDYPVMARITHDTPPKSPEWQHARSPFPVRLPSGAAIGTSGTENPPHLLPPVQSSTVISGFWPENFQEIRHLMEEQTSFSRDLPQSLLRSSENRLPAEESPLIAEREPLLIRPASANSLSDSERSVRSLASILSGIQISATNPFVTAMESKEPLIGTISPVPPIVSLPSSPSTMEALSAEFVADRNIADGQVIAPGAEFLKAWVMRNGGNRPWPDNTELVFVAGESLAKDDLMQPQLVGAVQPDEQIDLWTGELKAPEIPGRYVAYYRLRDGEGNLFGHSIWLDINVSESSETDSPETLASSESYLSSSSIMVMPKGAPIPSAAANSNDDNGAPEDQSVNSSMPASPATAPSTHTISDEVEISDNDSETSGSLLSISDSDSDEELWQDSRTSVHVEGHGAESQVTLTATQQPDEYVVLYDEATSSEEE